MVVVLVKNFGHHWPTTKNCKIAPAKCPKTVIKNEIWTRKWMIKNLILGIYLLHFLVFCQKKLHLFYEAQLTQHYKKYTPGTQPKTYFLLVSEKKIHCTISRRPNSYICIHIPKIHRSVLKKVIIDLLYFWGVYDISLWEKKLGRSSAYSCRTNIFI